MTTLGTVASLDFETIGSDISDAPAPYATLLGAGHSNPDLDYFSSSALTLNGGTIKDGAGNAASLTLSPPGAAASLGANEDLLGHTVIVSWSIETVDPGPHLGGYKTSLALDSQESARVAYRQKDDAGPDTLWYASKQGLSWNIEPVPSGPNNYLAWPSLAVGQDNLPRIAYHQYDPGQTLRYAEHDGTNWHIETVDTPSTGFFPSLALDANDLPWISYGHAAGPNLDSAKVAYYDGSSWQRQWLLSGVPDGVSPTIQLDSSGNPRVTYTRGTSSVGYAAWNGSSWDHQTVDGSVWVGWDLKTALDLDSGDNPHVLYGDVVSRRTGDDYAADALKYAFWNGSSWHVETVDDYVRTAMKWDLVLDANDNPRITYVSWDHVLKYAAGQWNANSQAWDWQIDVVDTTGGVPSGLSLVLDAAGNPSISYYSGGELRLARKDITAPHLTSFTRQIPASSPTNADTLVFRATFDEAVTGVDAADFAVNGATTATVTDVSQVNGSTYDVTVSGGTLFEDDFDDETYADKWDTYNGNSFTAGGGVFAIDSGFGTDDARAVLKSGLWDSAWNEYTVDVDFNMGETLPGYSPPHLALLFNVQAIAEGYNLGQYYQFYSLPHGCGLVRLESTTSNTWTDLVFTEYADVGRSDLSRDTWYHARLVVEGSTVKGFVGQPDGTYLDTPLFTYDIPPEYSYTGPIALKAIAGATNLYDNVTISGGNLAGFNGVVGLDLSASQNITDLAGNLLPAGEPGTDETYTVDNEAPAVTLSVTSPTSDTTPSVTVTATDSGSGVPDGTTVYLDVDLNNDGDFADSGETGYALSSLVSGAAMFDVSPALPGGTFLLQARVSDLADNEGFSSVETLEIQATAGISGTKWNDLNGDSAWDPAEPGLAGWRIFVDENANGEWDTAEPNDITDTEGNYAITGLSAGTHVVSEVPMPGWQQTYPERSGHYQATLLPFGFDDISATGNVGMAPDVDDGYFELTAADLAGFHFQLYGTTYDHAFVSSNGLITFGSGVSRYSNSDLTTSPDEAAIAVLWDDLVVSSSESPDAAILWEVRGSGDDQRLVLQWNEIPFYGGYGEGAITFQAILSELDGSIQFNYLNLQTTGWHSEGASATAGIKDAGAQGENRLLLSYNSGPNEYVGSEQSVRISRAVGPVPHVVTVGSGQVVENINFGNQATLGEIHGSKWNDLDGNSEWDPEEPGLADWTIWLDLDANGQPDPGEPSAVTRYDDPGTPEDETGSYSFTNLAAGTYTVAEVMQEGWEQTFPRRGSQTPSSDIPSSTDQSASGTSVTLDSIVDVEKLILAGDPNGTPPDSPSQRVDPNATESDWAGVGSLDIGGRFLCSATAIDPQHVLTAAHCLDTDDDGNSDFEPEEVSFHLNYGTDLSHTIGAASLHIHPDFTGFNNPSINDDLAVIKLQTALPNGMPVYDIHSRPLTSGNALTMVGYGTTGDGVSGYQFGTASFTTKRFGENSADLFGSDDEGSGAMEITAWDFDGPPAMHGSGPTGGPTLGNDIETQIGPGDSGGPSFVNEDGTWKLAAVNTFGGQFEDWPAPDGRFTSAGGGIALAPYSEWIDSIVHPNSTPGTHTVTIGPGEVARDVDFGNRRMDTERQIVSGPASVSAPAGRPLRFGVRYDTSTGDSTLSGLGLRMHYDSSFLSFDGLTDVLPTNFIAQQGPMDDAEDFDDDSSTDRYVLIAWSDPLGGNWPNETLPLDLLDARFQFAEGLEVGATTNINFTGSSTAAGYEFDGSSVLAIVVPPVNLDVDDNSTADALTDGVLILRYLFGFTGEELVRDAIGSGAGRSDPGDIGQFLDAGRATMLDPDDNGVADALTDGVVILRYLFGFTGEELVRGAIGSGANRTDPDEIADFLRTYLPSANAVATMPSSPGGSATPSTVSSLSTTMGRLLAGEGEPQTNVQLVTPAPESQTVAGGDQVSFDVTYTTSPEDPALTGLGLRMHFNSAVLSFDALSNVLSTNLVAQQAPQADTPDFDNDPSTDQFVLIAWSDPFGGNWPGALPATLCTAAFTAPADFADETTVNFSASSTTAGFDFSGTPAHIRAESVPPTELLQIRLETTDLVGNPISSIVEGDSLLLSGYVEDLRPDPAGVFAAYVDVTYDPVLATVTGDIAYGPSYSNVQGGDTASEGLIDEVGAVADLAPLGDGEFLLFSVPLVATIEGQASFATDPADVLPHHQSLLFGQNDPVSAAQIIYGTATIDILPAVTARDDSAAADEDNTVDLAVLANDIGEGLTIIAFDAESERGSTVTDNGDGTLRYDPRSSAECQALASGEVLVDSFTYTIRDTHGTTATATVTVTVNGVNDAPTVWNLIPDQRIMPTFAFSLTIPEDTFVDIEDDALSDPEVSGLPGWLAFDAETRTFNGTPTVADVGEFTIEVTATDSGEPRMSATDVFSITVYNPYQNLDDPCDVNYDGLVTPIDALIVINELNGNGSRELPIPPEPPLLPPPYPDVNGDLYISPLDALFVINRLNAPDGEGEPPAAVVNPSAADRLFSGAGEIVHQADAVPLLPVVSGSSDSVDDAPWPWHDSTPARDSQTAELDNSQPIPTSLPASQTDAALRLDEEWDGGSVDELNLAIDFALDGVFADIAEGAIGL